MPNSPALGPSRHPTTSITLGRHTRGSPSIVSSRGSSPGATTPPTIFGQQPIPGQQEPLTLEDYSNRMEAAAVMLAQLNANLVREPVTGAFGAVTSTEAPSGTKSWIPGSGWITGTSSLTNAPSSEAGIPSATAPPAFRMRLQPSEAAEIRERIMQEMMALEEERMTRTRADFDGWSQKAGYTRGKTAEDEGIVRRELNKADPSAAIFQESFKRKKARIRHTSPYGHFANWDVRTSFVFDNIFGEFTIAPSVSLLSSSQVRTCDKKPWLANLSRSLLGYGRKRIADAGSDSKSSKDYSDGSNSSSFRILITGSTSGLVETVCADYQDYLIHDTSK